MSHNHTRAKRGLPFTTDETDYETLRSVVDFFLSRYQYLDGDKRLQKLVFYTDYRHYQEHDHQLTNAAYTPYIYGLFSDDTRNALQNSNSDVERIVIRGNRMKRYHTIDNPDLSEVPIDFLEQIHEETRDISTADLATFAKNVPVFAKTEYGETAEFTAETVESI